MKLAALTLTNTSNVTRQISVFGYVDWWLGPPRAGHQRFVVTEMDDERHVMLARNAFNPEFGQAVAFWRATAVPRSRAAPCSPRAS